MWVPQWVDVGGVVPEDRVAELCNADDPTKALRDWVELVWWPEQSK
jgi:hypothetical protein